ncbi:hypothetical protein BBP40_007898 [Aspergillus hancockii]|nr:hypothetical protein BBP40_007898 [Aspergillus hancockii]
MAHTFYTTEGEISFDPQSKRDVISLPNSTQDGSKQEIVDRTTGAITPSMEGEGKSRSSTRRRIPVACNRCRKRKIKCSGDPGDGLGCVNCRASGNVNCHFLRVNSSMLQAKASGWPYPATNATLSSSHQSQGVYAPPVAPKQDLLAASPSNFRVGSLSRSLALDMGSAEPQHSYSRPNLGHDSTVSFEDEASTTYGSQHPNYVLPTTPQGALPDYCGLSWSKAWVPDLNATRAPNGGILPDHEAESAFHHSSYAYMLPGSGAPSLEPPFVPTMVALSSEGQGMGRTLPTPSGRCQHQMGSPAFPTSAETISALPQQECRNRHPWTLKSVTSDIRPMKQCTPGSFNGSPIVRTKLLPTNPQDMVLGYLPMTSTSASSPLIPSSGTCTRLNPGDIGEELRSNEEARVSRLKFHEHPRLSLIESSSEIYGYCSLEKSRKGVKPGTSSPAATLMGGLPYTRPPAQLQSAPLAFSLPVVDSLTDTRSPTDARTQTLSNPGGFYSEAC